VVDNINDATKVLGEEVVIALANCVVKCPIDSLQVLETIARVSILQRDGWSNSRINKKLDELMR